MAVPSICPVWFMVPVMDSPSTQGHLVTMLILFVPSTGFSARCFPSNWPSSRASRCKLITAFGGCWWVCWWEQAMALGRRGQERQAELRVATNRVAAGARHVFYDRLNHVLISPTPSSAAESMAKASRRRRGIFPVKRCKYLSGASNGTCGAKKGTYRNNGFSLSAWRLMKLAAHSACTSMRNRWSTWIVFPPSDLPEASCVAT